MKESLVTIELDLFVQGEEAVQIVNQYDGFIAGNGVHIVNFKGEELVAECLGSKFIEVVDITDDEETTILNRNPSVKYHLSSNKVFSIKDMLRIEDKGDFNIIMNQNCSFLFNANSLETIDTNTNSIEELKVYLEKYFPYYKVLRKID